MNFAKLTEEDAIILAVWSKVIPTCRQAPSEPADEIIHCTMDTIERLGDSPLAISFYVLMSTLVCCPIKENSTFERYDN